MSNVCRWGAFDERRFGVHHFSLSFPKRDPYPAPRTIKHTRRSGTCAQRSLKVLGGALVWRCSQLFELLKVLPFSPLTHSQRGTIKDYPGYTYLLGSLQEGVRGSAVSRR